MNALDMQLIGQVTNIKGENWWTVHPKCSKYLDKKQTEKSIRQGLPTGL